MKHLRYATGIFVLILSATAGCDNKEKVFDLDTPGGGVEVERDRDSGAISVEVEDE